jgi:predicted aspartyl protease
MPSVCWVMVANMFLFPPVQEPENPWKDKVPAAVEKAERSGSVADLSEALDAAWRADDWQTGLRLAQQALKAHPDEAKLQGIIIRALWRAGRLKEAEDLAAKIPPNTRDRVALASLVTIHLAHARFERAADVAERLGACKSLTAVELYQVIAVRFAQNRLAGLAGLLRKVERLTDPDNGYPEIYMEEHLDGLAEFFDAVGTEPLNQVTEFGTAPMPLMPLINLPGCVATINGHGPYRMIFDTGGSITLSLDEQVAADIGLKSVADATIRGVSGKDTSGQAVLGELKIGDITCKRVMTRIFDLRGQIFNAADGIIGTGIFAESRLTLDFEHARMIVTPSSANAAGGTAVDIRVVGDAKLVAPAILQGERATALLDSGASVVAFAPSRLKRLFPDQPVKTIQGAGMGVGGGAGPTINIGRGVDLVFAGRDYDEYSGLGLDVLDTVLSPILGVQCDALIGMPVFREMKSWTVDFPRCQMWVDWLEE